MTVFIQVVEQGGFSQAARQLTMTPSAVSKLITRMEDRLGGRLFNRTTRHLDLTDEGRAFYEQAVRIMGDMDAAELSVRAGTIPSGRVTLNTSSAYAAHILAPALPDFFDAYPEITLDLIQTDQVVDIVAEKTDIAVRAGPLRSSSLMARKLGETRMLLVAAPAYLDRYGQPESPEDLSAHHRLGFGYPREVNGWHLTEEDQTRAVSPRTSVRVNDGEGMRQLALNGIGMARLAEFMIRDDLRSGRLISILTDAGFDTHETFHAVYVGKRGPVPARVRVLLDYLARYGRVY